MELRRKLTLKENLNNENPFTFIPHSFIRPLGGIMTADEIKQPSFKIGDKVIIHSIAEIIDVDDKILSYQIKINGTELWVTEYQTIRFFEEV